jgi:alpha-L-fucosidase
MGGGGMGAPSEGKSNDIRFNRSKDNKILYAIFLGPPSGAMTISGLKSGGSSPVTGVTLVGTGDACTFTQEATGLKVTPPSAASSNPNGYAVKITFSGNVPAAN